MLDPVRAFYHVQYRNALLTLHGEAFERFAVAVLRHRYPNVKRVRPAGVHGDGKTDAYIPAEGLVIQMYAPKRGVDAVDSEMADKVRTSLVGAREQWGPHMRSWVFLHNLEALGRRASRALADLRADHQDVKIDDWDRDCFWRDQVSQLEESELAQLFVADGDLARAAADAQSPVVTPSQQRAREVARGLGHEAARVMVIGCALWLPVIAGHWVNLAGPVRIDTFKGMGWLGPTTVAHWHLGVLAFLIAVPLSRLEDAAATPARLLLGRVYDRWGAPRPDFRRRLRGMHLLGFALVAACGSTYWVTGLSAKAAVIFTVMTAVALTFFLAPGSRASQRPR